MVSSPQRRQELFPARHKLICYDPSVEVLACLLDRDGEPSGGINLLRGAADGPSSVEGVPLELGEVKGSELAGFTESLLAGWFGS